MKEIMDIRGFITLMNNGVDYSVWELDSLREEELEAITNILYKHETEGGSNVVERNVAFGMEPDKTDFQLILEMDKLFSAGLVVEEQISELLQLERRSSLSLHNLRDMVVMWYSEKNDGEAKKSMACKAIDTILFNGGNSHDGD